MGQAARTGKVAEPWTALCSTLQYFIVQPVRSSANWEKAGVGFLHDCVAECRSQANRLPLWAPTPPPPPPTAKEGLDPVFSHQPGFSSAQDPRLVPGPAISDRSAARRAGESLGRIAPGRAQGWRGPTQGHWGILRSGEALPMLGNWPPAREEKGEEMGETSKRGKLPPEA